MKEKLSLFLLAIVLAGLGGFLYSRGILFKVANVQVEGVSRDLEAQMEQEMLGFYGRSLFSVELAEVEKKIIPFGEIDSVRIMRIWPDTLRVLLVAREAVALEFVESKLYVLDEEARPFAELSEAISRPLLRGFESSANKVKGHLLKFLEKEQQLSIKLGRSEGPDVLDLTQITYLGDGLARFVFEDIDLSVDVKILSLEKSWPRIQRAHKALFARKILANVMNATNPAKVFIYKSRELQKSESGINLKELVHRTRSETPSAR